MCSEELLHFFDTLCQHLPYPIHKIKNPYRVNVIHSDMLRMRDATMWINIIAESGDYGGDSTAESKYAWVTRETYSKSLKCKMKENDKWRQLITSMYDHLSQNSSSSKAHLWMIPVVPTKVFHVCDNNHWLYDLLGVNKDKHLLRIRQAIVLWTLPCSSTIETFQRDFTPYQYRSTSQSKYQYCFICLFMLLASYLFYGQTGPTFNQVQYMYLTIAFLLFYSFIITLFIYLCELICCEIYQMCVKTPNYSIFPAHWDSIDLIH